MITKELLKKYASNLMFNMSDEEYNTLLDEFEIILNQMDLIDKIDGIDEVEPMTFPFLTYDKELREDKAEDSLSTEEVLKNAAYKTNNQVQVPKVVE